MAITTEIRKFNNGLIEYRKNILKPELFSQKPNGTSKASMSARRSAYFTFSKRIITVDISDREDFRHEGRVVFRRCELMGLESG